MTCQRSYVSPRPGSGRITLLLNDSFIDADHNIVRKIRMRQIENPVTLLGYLYDETQNS